MRFSAMTGGNSSSRCCRCGPAWRDLSTSFGAWQTMWKRHRRFSEDGTWDKIHQALDVYDAARIAQLADA